MRFSSINTTHLILAAAAVLGLWYIKGQAVQFARDNADKVNPTSDENIFYQGISAIVDTVDDGMNNDSNTLGTWAYDQINGSE